MKLVLVAIAMMLEIKRPLISQRGCDDVTADKNSSETIIFSFIISASMIFWAHFLELLIENTNILRLSLVIVTFLILLLFFYEVQERKKLKLLNGVIPLKKE